MSFLTSLTAYAGRLERRPRMKVGTDFDDAKKQVRLGLGEVARDMHRQSDW